MKTMLSLRFCPEQESAPAKEEVRRSLRVILLDHKILEAVQGEFVAADPFHQAAFARTNAVYCLDQFRVVTGRNVQQSVTVAVQSVAGPHHHAMNLNRDAAPYDMEIGMASDASTREVVKAERMDLREIANGAVAHQTDGSQLFENRGHDFATVG